MRNVPARLIMDKILWGAGVPPGDNISFSLPPGRMPALLTSLHTSYIAAQDGRAPFMTLWQLKFVFPNKDINFKTTGTP